MADLKIIAIVQARTRSTRLLNKVMLPIKGKPMIGYLLDRLESVQGLDGIVVAMPRSDYGSSLFKYVESRQIMAFAGGEENNVVARFLGVIDATGCDGFVRICADSPLLDGEFVAYAAAMLRTANNEDAFFSNVGLRCICRGQSVEAVATGLYRQLAAKCDPEDREHAGFPYIYRGIEHKSLLVDTPEDFERVKRVIESMDGDHREFGWAQCANLLP